MTEEKNLNKTRIRNLRQYKNKTDEEFDDIWSQMEQGIQMSSEFDKRINNKLDSFAEDYDLSDLKVNDLLTLRALAQALITLEDYEAYSFNLRRVGVSLDNMIIIEKISNIMSSLRKDISSMQNDLSITRKIRKGDKEQSVISEIDRLKQKAKEFYEKRMMYVFCPKCNNLLCTAWFHYPDDRKNKLVLVCNRQLDNGELCKEKLIIGTNELLNSRGVNSENVPDSFK